MGFQNGYDPIVKAFSCALLDVKHALAATIRPPHIVLKSQFFYESNKFKLLVCKSFSIATVPYLEVCFKIGGFSGHGLVWPACVWHISLYVGQFGLWVRRVIHLCVRLVY